MKRILSKEIRAEDRRLEQGEKRRARLKGQFLARLMSIDSLHALSPEDKTALLKDAKRSGFISVNAVDAFLWPLLQHVHEVAYPLIRDALQGKEVSLRPLGACERTCFRFNPSEGVFTETHGDAWWCEEMLLHLWWILRNGSFPFRRCPWCNAGVFFLFGTRKYCSPRCTSQANEAKRTGTRNEYQRAYMKKWGKKRKEKAQEKKQVRSSVVKFRGTR